MPKDHDDDDDDAATNKVQMIIMSQRQRQQPPPNEGGLLQGDEDVLETSRRIGMHLDEYSDRGARAIQIPGDEASLFDVVRPLQNGWIPDSNQGGMMGMAEMAMQRSAETRHHEASTQTPQPLENLPNSHFSSNNSTTTTGSPPPPSIVSHVVDFAVGWNHVLIVEKGCIMAIGYGMCGNLGLGNEHLSYGASRPGGFSWSGESRSALTDTDLKRLRKLHQNDISPSVERVWCGMNFSFAQTSDKALWGCGWNNQLQLASGVNDKEVISWTLIPMHEWNTTSSDWPLTHIATGAMHTFFLFEKKIDKDKDSHRDNSRHSTIQQGACSICSTKRKRLKQDLYFAGQNGKSGMPQQSDKVLARMDGLQVMRDHVVKQIESADEHTFILTHCGQVFACGLSKCFGIKDESYDWTTGKLPEVKLSYFTQIPFLDLSDTIKQIETGDLYTLFLTSSGRIFVTGIEPTPIELPIPSDYPIVHMAAGSQGFAIADSRSNIFLYDASDKDTLRNPSSLLRASRKMKIDITKFKRLNLDLYLSEENCQQELRISDYSVQKMGFGKRLLFILLREKVQTMHVTLQQCLRDKHFADVIVKVPEQATK